MDKVLHSSKKMDYRTPEEVLKPVRKLGPIALDPCADQDEKHWFAKYNWTDFEERYQDNNTPFMRLAYLNPPYGRALLIWVQRRNKIAECWVDETVLLVPARTDTKWFEMAWNCSNAYCFWKGRIKFVGGKNSAPLPSVLFYTGRRTYKFCDIFQDKGLVGVI